MNWLTTASIYLSFDEARIQFAQWLYDEISIYKEPMVSGRDWDVVPRSIMNMLFIDRIMTIRQSLSTPDIQEPTFSSYMRMYTRYWLSDNEDSCNTRSLEAKGILARFRTQFKFTVDVNR